MRTTSAVCAVSKRVGAIAALFTVLTGTAAGQYLRGVNVSQAEWGDPLNEAEVIRQLHGNYSLCHCAHL
jgi:hypothetical protein